MENHTSEIGGHRAGCHCETCFQLRSVVEKTAAGVEELTTEQIHKTTAVGLTDLTGTTQGKISFASGASISFDIDEAAAIGDKITDSRVSSESVGTMVINSDTDPASSTRNISRFITDQVAKLAKVPAHLMDTDAPVIDAAGKVPSGMPLTVRVDVKANSMVDSGAIASHVARIMESVAKRGKLATSKVPELKPTAFGGAADWAAAIHALNTPPLVMRLGDNCTEAQFNEFLTGMPQMHMGGVVYPSQKSFSQQKLDHLRDAILPSSRTRSSQSTTTTDHEALKLRVRDAELAFDALIREVLLSTTDHDRSIKRLRARHADMIEEICEMKGFYL